MLHEAGANLPGIGCLLEVRAAPNPGKSIGYASTKDCAGKGFRLYFSISSRSTILETRLLVAKPSTHLQADSFA
jgi:hypothetical protein